MPVRFDGKVVTPGAEFFGARQAIGGKQRVVRFVPPRRGYDQVIDCFYVSVQ